MPQWFVQFIHTEIIQIEHVKDNGCLLHLLMRAFNAESFSMVSIVSRKPAVSINRKATP
jgi:hypothetical protein